MGNKVSDPVFISGPNGKNCIDCSVSLNETNFAASQEKKHFYICTPCQNKRMQEANNLFAVIRLQSGEFRQCRHRDKKRFLEKNSGSIYVGKFDKRQTSFDEFVKSVNSGLIPAIIPKIKKERPKKFKTARRAASEIMSRVKTINSDRTINRYGRKGARKLFANLYDSEGNLLKWFEDMYDNATHCAITGIEFEVEGPNQKSPDQIVAGNNYTEENIHIVCEWCNYGKHDYPLDVFIENLKRAGENLNSKPKELSN